LFNQTVDLTLKSIVTAGGILRPSIIDAREGKTATFLCSSETEVIWRFKNKEVPNNVKIGVFKNHQTSDYYKVMTYFLVIINVTKQNLGYYTCFGTQFSKAVEEKSVLRVKDGKKSSSLCAVLVIIIIFII